MATAMYRRLQYLLAEGFSVSMLTGPDHWDDVHFEGKARVTYTFTDAAGKVRLHSEEFDVTPTEWQECAGLFLKTRDCR